MKLLKHGKDISVSVENITPFGIWLYVRDKEYFLSYKDYPYFKDQTLSSIQNVQLVHGYHLYWPELDVDLEIDNLENPEKYPLKSKITKKHPAIHSTGRRITAPVNLIVCASENREVSARGDDNFLFSE